MNVFIMTDLEGISGVNTMTAITEVGGEENRFACERLMADTNAAIDGAFLAGAEKVFVVDGHGAANNFIDELLDERATKVSVKDFSQVIQSEKIAAYIQIGAHAKPGTLNGFLDHVQSSETWYDYRINGTSYGELVQGGTFAGAYGIPCVMVSGDEAACKEAKNCFGENIVCVPVKKGIGRNSAECCDLKEAEEKIREGVKQGIERAARIEPFKLQMPLNVQLDFTRSDYCDECCKRRPDVTRIGARTVEMTVEKIVNYGDILFW